MELGAEAAAASVTVCDPLATPALLTETDTVPALTLETANVRVSPLPDTTSRVAEPVPDVIVKSLAAIAPGLRLNVKVIEVVVGLPAAAAVQVTAASSAIPMTVAVGALVTLPE